MVHSRDSGKAVLTSNTIPAIENADEQYKIQKVIDTASAIYQNLYLHQSFKVDSQFSFTIQASILSLQAKQAP